MEALSSILFSLFRGTEHHHLWLVSCLDGAWRGLLGERLAQACRPVALRRQELIVEVADAAWLPTLQDMRQDLLRRIQSASGSEVQSLAFQLQGKSGVE